MMNVRMFTVGVLFAGLASQCYGQQVAQVVQLPTFQFFSVSTTVSVPDSGSSFLGGVKRAQYNGVSRGVPLVSKVPGLVDLPRRAASARVSVRQLLP